MQRDILSDTTITFDSDNSQAAPALFSKLMDVN